MYTAEDVILAIHHGIDGVVVSNHGGRQLDSVTATLDALPEIVEAAAGRIPVHIDSGVRRGTDIFKALALGADHVWVGRAVIWGLAHSGEAGVDLVIEMLRSELLSAMALAGYVETYTRVIILTHLDVRPSSRLPGLTLRGWVWMVDCTSCNQYLFLYFVIFCRQASRACAM